MVSAVSSQAATLNRPAYAAQVEDDSSSQAVPAATSNDSDRGPATQVSWSQASQDLLAAAQQSGQDLLAAYQAASDTMHRRFEVSQINVQLRLLDQQDSRQDTNTAGLKRLQASYDKMLNSPISPEVTLNAADAAKALQMLKEAGRTLPLLGPNVTYGFVKDGIQYNFRGDGTVTTRKEGVATSIEDQQKALASIRGMMDFVSSDIRDNTAARAALIAQHDALMGQ